MNDYEMFLAGKAMSDPPTGFDADDLNPAMFPYQHDITRWALRRGRAAIFAGCGLGKTLMQLEWSRRVADRTQGQLLILTPLAVAPQTVAEGERFGITASYATDPSEIHHAITVTNYDRLDRFDPSRFAGIVLDESSILKAFDGATRTALIESFGATPYRLACTATPAPNDYMELGNHSEFLGVLTRAEMLATFFCHDGGETQKWRLKGHAEHDFWTWLCSWAVMLRMPSDLGYSDEGFVLPPCEVIQHTVRSPASDGALFALEAQTLQERLAARRESTEPRVIEAETIIRQSWTKTKNANTTAPTGSPTRIASSPNVARHTRLTQSDGARNHATAPPAIATASLQHSASMSKATANSVSPTCANDTGDNGISLSPSSEPAGHPAPPLTKTATCSANTESPSLISMPGSPRRITPAPFAEPARPGSVLTTTTHPASSGDYSAGNATPGSDSCETLPPSCAEQPSTLRPQWVVWCALNAEQDALAARLGADCVSIYGSLTPEDKTARYQRFERGEVSVMISKVSIFGFGMNMQFCSHALFLGLSDSWESYYQAIRRQWRFGQQSPVTAHLITAEAEGAVVSNIKRKDADAEAMAANMVSHMQELSKAAVQSSGRTRSQVEHTTDVATADRWTLHQGDCVDVLRSLAPESVHFSIFSPPFASLYTYSASDRDMGNVRDHAQFYEHFRFCVRELFRVTKSGRLVSFHCMNLPTSKVRDGVIGITDFRGDLIRMFQTEGFIYHSEVVIWKDPVTAMQRTKALGLLHKTIRNDSSMSRQGIPDYLVTMRKPGENAEPISHTAGEFPVTLWQRYASPVWMDINPSDTLQYRSAREHQDERHIAPLQLEVIRRALMLWSNPGDLVLSPFAGIGSEGVVALEEGRRFVGAELKPSYWRQAAKNLAAATEHKATDLFAMDAG